MHRVELKVDSPCNSPTTTYFQVPNAPCGVESMFSISHDLFHITRS